VQWIRYISVCVSVRASVQHADGAGATVLDPVSLSLPAPLLQQTWVCKASRHQVLLVHENDRPALRFDGAGLPMQPFGNG
jgi:hypothetical protein